MSAQAMEDKVAEMSPVKKFIFNVAYVGRATALRQHRDAPLLKALVFKKLAKMLGGKLKATSRVVAVPSAAKSRPCSRRVLCARGPRLRPHGDVLLGHGAARRRRQHRRGGRRSINVH